MREAEGAREALLQLLDDRVFSPALGKGRGEYLSESQQDELDHLKDEVRRQREQFHRPFRSAADIRAHYLELSSHEARTEELDRRLGLPPLSSIRAEFLRLCDELGVQANPGSTSDQDAAP